ncbi:MAG: biotin-dependent carboxyltransferase family protein [Geminicoccaceae bacterium]
MSGVFKIIEPGLQTTVQDGGRYGFQRFGVPVSGAMDQESLKLANALVGSAPSAPALEMRYAGLELEVVDGAVRVALTGTNAKMSVSLADWEQPITIEAYRSVTLQAGARLKCRNLGERANAYLAIAGELDLDTVMNSFATYLRGGFGGVSGRALRTDDVLRTTAGDSVGPDRQGGWPILPSDNGPIRVVLGPQSDFFSDDAIQRFLAAPWTISKDTDRMGMRLEGPKLEHAKGFNITSDGIATGAIQVPGSGQPIILLADRQTAGGYPKIATVASVDLPRLGRAMTGGTMTFVTVTVEEAQGLRRTREAELNCWIDGLEPVRETGQIDVDALYRENLITGAVAADERDP